MRPQNQAARTNLESDLRRRAPASASELAERLKISLPTLHRIVKEKADRIIRMGATKNARYALRRKLRGGSGQIPIYSISENGTGQSSGMLDLVDPEGSVMNLEAIGWPVDEAHRGGWWGGLPYPIYDMRPQGFLGRNLARRASRDLGVAENPEAWSDDDIVHVLSRRGSDTVGNLIVGDDAYRLWLDTMVNPQPIIPLHEQSDRYAEMANEAAGSGIVGSSAAGEFPKFTACRDLPGTGTPHVIVKFSGADDSSAVRRWSDLLVCEHLALSVLDTRTGLHAASSRILTGQGRTFLEVERFDRNGMHGRRAMISLACLDAAVIGSGNASWPELAGRLSKMGMLSNEIVDQVQILWWYGKLIANTDMHLGNLSFRFDPQPGRRPALILARAYDMLPMQYAPLSGGEVPPVTFNPALPLPSERTAWNAAFAPALVFWETAASDARISDAFRTICRQNLDRLAGLINLP